MCLILIFNHTIPYKIKTSFVPVSFLCICYSRWAFALVLYEIIKFSWFYIHSIVPDMAKLFLDLCVIKGKFARINKFAINAYTTVASQTTSLITYILNPFFFFSTN